MVNGRPSIICAGLAVMDQVYSVERLPEAPRKHFATGFREVGGGPAASAAVAVARLGGEARRRLRISPRRSGGTAQELRSVRRPSRRLKCLP